MSSSVVLNIGTRNSPLAQTQTAAALKKISTLLPSIEFKTILAESPGDRNKVMDLREAPQDFFTKDLDEMICSGKADLAIHSAKDLPELLRPELDYFFLPWREDPRDALLLPKGKTDVPTGIVRVGVSSERREAYSRQTWPSAELLPIRGNIEERIEQMDNGKFDLIILAVAGLNRLGLSDRITRKIPVEELPVSEAQGILAVTFRKGDQRLIKIRNLLLPPVILAGAGIGSQRNTTFAVHEAMKTCEYCLYDALLPKELLANLPETAISIPVGKRAGHHSVKQTGICELLVTAGKEGKKVLRLKGGDPSVFGRLAEETDRLEQEQIPFMVLPGISSYSVGAATTGLLPTRREISRGFTLFTPRMAGTHAVHMPSENECQAFSKVLYMASHAVSQVCESYLKEGIDPLTPVAVILSAGDSDEEVLFGSLENPPILEKNSDIASKPGLVLIGKGFSENAQFKQNAPLSGIKIMYCGSLSGVDKARKAIEEQGGYFLSYPMISLTPTPQATEIVTKLDAYDVLIVTSPSSADLFLETCKKQAVDIRTIPEIWVCGPGTANVFIQTGLQPTICPKQNFSTEGLLSEIEAIELSGKKILRIISDKASLGLSEQLRKKGGIVEDITFYTNQPISYDSLPKFDAVLFTSNSTVNGFSAHFKDALDKKIIACSISEKTEAAVHNSNLFGRSIVAPKATVSNLVTALAAHFTDIEIGRTPNG